MALSRKIKTGIIAFLVFDVMLVVAMVTLYSVRSERQLIEELRDLGVATYPEARELSEFSMIDQTGEAFTNANLTGHWSMLFFGFTHCPDICPLTMAELKQFYEQLDSPNITEELRIVMVSVDPDRDTPAEIGSYVNSFNDNFLGVTGSAASIGVLADEVFIARSEPLPMDEHSEHIQNNEYLIEHSGHVALINPEGQFKAAIRPPVRDQDLLKIYQLLIED